MDTLRQDLRFAWRALRKSPTVTATAVITLGLGIGGASALFSVISGVLLEPLPYPEPQALFRVFENSATYTDFPISPANFLDHRDALAGAGTADLAVYMRSDQELSAGQRSERLMGMQVSAGFFRVLGTPPLLGRDISRQDELAAESRVVLLSHRLWQRQFEGETNALGKSILLGGQSHTVVGVVPAGLQHVGGSYRSAPHGTVVDVWLPLGLDPATARRGSHYLNAIGRLRPNVTREQAIEQMGVTTERLAAEYPGSNEGWWTSAVPLAHDIVGGTRRQLMVLQGAVGLVLLIACVNVANLLLARATARRQEIGVRRALGAGNARLVRQLMTESLTLATAGGVVGLLIAVGGVEALRALAPEQLPRLHEVAIEGRVLGFTVGVTLLTGLLFGCLPALNAVRTSLRETLQTASGAVVGGRDSVRGTLVVAELALAIVLLVGAGLLLRSFAELRGAESGFKPQGVLTASVALPSARYPESSQVAAFFPRLLERIEALPGVESAGAGSDLPWTGYDENMSMIPEDRLGDEDARFRVRFHMATPGYFKSLGVPVLAGREVNASDDREAPQRVVVNARLAELAWPGGDAVGRRLTWSRDPEEGDFHTVIGVVGDVKDAPGDADLLPSVYFPHAQQTWRNGLQLVVRMAPSGGIVGGKRAVDPRAVVDSVRRELRALDPDLPLADVATLADVADGSYAEARFLSWLTGSFAAMALVLAMVGLYGVMSYSVSRRQREIALRMALGAAAGQVLRWMVARGMRLVLAGVVAGVAGALALSHFLEGMLYGVRPTDPWTLGVVVVLLGAVALMANLLPARRASRVDPVEALRYE